MSLISDSVREAKEKLQRVTNSPSVLNIIEFAENKQIGFGLTLYPTQKFILKLFYKLPLSGDIEDNRIIIRDKYNEEIIGEYSEIEFFHFLFAQKQINMSYKDYLSLEEDPIELDFFIGRRGTKTTTTTIIFGYTAYVLIKLKNPHKFFGVIRSEPICFTVVSNTEDGALRQFGNLKQMLTTCKFFKPYIRGSNSKGYWLATPRFKQLEEIGVTMEAKGDLQFVGSAATSKVRGAANIDVMLDEYGHFRDSGVVSKQKPLDVQIYNALTPSVAGFVDDNNKSYGKIFVATSPNGKKGDAYKKFKDSFKSKSVLMLKMPSHWVNTRLSSQHLRKMYMESESSAEQEYGARFIESTGNFIKNIAKLKASINLLWGNTFSNARKKGKYFMSADLAQNSDGFAIAISHKERYRPEMKHIQEMGSEIDYAILVAKKDIVVLDYYLQVVPEDGGTIHHSVILSLFKKMYGAFNIVKCTIDQWGYQVYSELLEDVIDIDTLELIVATQETNNIIARNFNTIVGEGRAMLPADVLDDATEECISTLEEILSLVETVLRGGMIKVQAPIGGHDDRWSAISRSMYMAESSDNESQNLLASGGVVTYGSVSTYSVKQLLDQQVPLTLVDKTKVNKTNIKLKKFNVRSEDG